MQRVLTLLALCFAASAIAYAGTGVAFLEIPVGARESALGGVGAALHTGPTSAVYNPAMVAELPRSAVLVHTRHFAETRAQFVGINLRRGRFAFAPHYWGTRVSDIEYREAPTRDPISIFDATNATVGAALAFKIAKHFSAGILGRYLHQKIHVESADGYAVDAGVLASNLWQGVSLGAAVNHLGHMNSFAVESPELPTTLRGGAVYERALSKYGTLLVAADALGIRDQAPQFRAGIEYRAPGYAAVRVGWIEGLDAQDLSVGFGVFIKHYRLDYAFIPFRENLGEGHRFALTVDI